ncbi:MAG: phosphotransferase family protein [Pseudomonadota bacterium]
MPDTMNPIATPLAATLAREISGVIGIENLKRLSGGASQETWAFDAIQGDKAIPLILRRAPGSDRDKNTTSAGLETEAALIKLAGEVNVPIPPVRLVLKAEDGVGRGFIMDRVEGETIARKILRDDEFAGARPKLARQCGEILARLHSVDMAKLPPLRLSTAKSEIEQYFQAYKTHNHPHPVFDLAFRWLRDNLPDETPRVTLVHGDFRNGNLIIGADGVRAVLDWELAHMGDPMEDLAWICVNSWRFGNIDNPVGGFGQREDMFAGYEASGGDKVDPERVKFWEVLGTLKWGVMCTTMVMAFKAGDRSVERATIGRRSSETEVDLLRLLAPLKKG